jgi:hypothetical protein
MPRSLIQIRFSDSLITVCMTMWHVYIFIKLAYLLLLFLKYMTVGVCVLKKPPWWNGRHGSFKLCTL